MRVSRRAAEKKGQGKPLQGAGPDETEFIPDAVPVRR